eukprot:3146214-Pyramimonas_sp.AAC.1
MAKITTTSTGGKAESGEAHVHAQPLLARLNSAVATKARTDDAPSKARSANSPRPSESGNDGSRESYHQRRLKEDKEMMAMFEIIDSEPDASDVQTQSPDIQEQE